MGLQSGDATAPRRRPLPNRPAATRLADRGTQQGAKRRRPPVSSSWASTILRTFDLTVFNELTVFISFYKKSTCVRFASPKSPCDGFTSFTRCPATPDHPAAPLMGDPSQSRPPSPRWVLGSQNLNRAKPNRQLEIRIAAARTASCKCLAKNPVAGAFEIQIAIRLTIPHSPR